MLTLRNSKSAEDLDRLSDQITNRLLELPEIKDSRVVSTYLHIGSEVRTSNLVNALLSGGKKVIVPVTDRVNKRLIFCEVSHPDRELVKGTYGILEPRPELRRPVPLEQADVILVPGVAWDLRGYRIGYGAGYYDRSINSLHKALFKVGLCYEFQIVQRVPNSRFDRKIDRLVTDRRVIDTTSNVNHHPFGVCAHH
jgi:5-formyltetrahydrofolate cyclo-ligase